MTAIAVSVKTQKGGEAKTTTVVNLAAFLAAMGQRVLVIDMDAQGHFSQSLSLVDKHNRPIEGIFNVLVNERPVNEFIFHVPEDEFQHVAQADGGCIHFIPGGAKTQVAAVHMQLGGGSDYTVLGKMIEPLRKSYDVMLIDNEPTVGLWLAAILYASQYVLIPSQMALLSLDGAEKFMLQFNNLAATHKCKVLGLLPVMTQPRTNNYRELMQRANKMFPGKVWEDVQITNSTVWKEASNKARSILSYMPTHQAAQQLVSLGYRFAKEIGLVLPEVQDAAESV